MSEKENVTLAIPVYGQWRYLDRCLRSALKFNFKAVVVDDCGDDVPTASYMTALDYAKHVRAYHNRKNVGFARTVNRAVKKVTTKYVCLCNSDIELVHQNAITDCIDRLEKDKNIGIMSVKLLHDDKTIQHAGVIMNWKDRGGNPIHRYRGKPRTYRKATVYEEVPFVTGAFMVMPTEVFFDVGGMPTVYGRGYYEDMELCINVREMGKRIMYNGTVWAFHFGHKSFNGAQFNFNNTERNMRIWQQRNLKKVVNYYPRNKFKYDPDE
jgi:GT2 family glycosyltransferase